MPLEGLFASVSNVKRWEKFSSIFNEVVNGLQGEYKTIFSPNERITNSEHKTVSSWKFLDFFSDAFIYFATFPHFNIGHFQLKPNLSFGPIGPRVF